jgi:N6-adenosine-specific RNA methylase IME4
MRFRVILADCPWEARDQLPGPKRGAKKIYKSTMSTRDIMVVYAPKTRVHSEKPEAAYQLIERLIGGLSPRVELFARAARPGWECMGNELGTEIGFGLFGSEAM